MLKKMIGLAILLLSEMALAGTSPLDIAIEREVEDIKKSSCEALSDKVQHAFGENQTVLVLAIPYEGCGGGNNWGMNVVKLSQFDGKKWKKRTNLRLNNVSHISYDRHRFVIDYLEYAQEDPRCCPSLKKQKIVSE